MLKQLKSTCAAGLLLLSVLAFSACDDRLLSDDYGPCPGSSSEAADSAALYLSFTMRVAGSGDTRADDDGTWGGAYTTDETTYDAVINPEEVHVALFSEAGEYVTTAARLSCTEASGTYQYYGVVEASLLKAGSTYRCMVVANTASVDFTQLSTQTYQAAALPQGGATNNYYIPMWGVRTFTYTKSSEAIEPILMLRAAAKCRIHFSEDLLKVDSKLKLKDVQYHSLTSQGYIAPTGYQTAASTGEISYTTCFNPAPTDDPTKVKLDENGEIVVDSINGMVMEDNTTVLDFLTEETTEGTTSAILYMPECVSDGTEVSFITMTVESSAGEAEYSVLLRSNNSNNLTRNHVYDLQITGIENGLTINMSAYWGWDYERTYFSDQISYQGETPIEWTAGTYSTIDYENKVVTLLSGVTLICQVNLKTPTQCKWVATLTTLDADDTSDAIIFSDEESTYLSGTIDGINMAVLRIQAADPNNNRQHRYSLRVYVRRQDKTTTELDEASGWTIVQTY
jgi:hypothetical protein